MDDLISRQAAITAIQKAYADTECGADKCAVWKNVGLTNALHIMQDLPSAQQDCTECEEYDHERHYCQKYCEVIRKTLEEAKPERTECNNCNEYDNEMKDCPHYCEVMRSTADGLQIEAYCNKRKLPEEAQEPTWEQIKDYCKKRCLVLITAEAYYELTRTTQPERTGRWIKISPAGIYECSKCGKYVMTDEIEAYAICHGCGVRMEGEADG